MENDDKIDDEKELVCTAMVHRWWKKTTGMICWRFHRMGDESGGKIGCKMGEKMSAIRCGKPGAKNVAAVWENKMGPCHSWIDVNYVFRRKKRRFMTISKWSPKMCGGGVRYHDFRITKNEWIFRWRSCVTVYVPYWIYVELPYVDVYVDLSTGTEAT